MNPTARALQLRQRAHHLRVLAESIEASPVMRLERYGDIDTWRGPRPALCLTTLVANQRQLHVAAEDLRWHAYRFEQQANELTAFAAAQIAG